MLRPIIAIAKTTLGEAIRRKVLLVILLIGLAGVVVAPGLSILTPRSEITTLKAMTLGIIQMTSALIAIVLTVYMIPNEIERRTIYTILSKPVQRWQFVVGKYFGAVAALGLMIFAMTAIMLVAVGRAVSFNPQVMADMIKGPFMFFCQMSLLASVAMLYSTFVSPLVNFFLSGGTYIVGTVFASVFAALSEGGNNMVTMLAKGVLSIIPNFSMFQIQNTLINQGQVLADERFVAIRAIVYALAYIAAAIGLACWIFERREV